MSRRRKVAVGFALFGFLLPAAVYGYMDMIDYAPNRVSTGLLFCPPCIASFPLLFDVNGHSLTGLFVMTFLSALNALLYFGLGSLIGRWLQDRS
jgi:hypothetical protein